MEVPDRLKGLRAHEELMESTSVFHFFCSDLVDRTLDSEPRKHKVLLLIILLSFTFSSDPKEN